MLVSHEIKKIFQSQRDRLRNADHPDMMRPKNNRKPLKGVARRLYLDKLAKLNKAEALATSGLGLSRMKVPETPVEKEKDNEEVLKKKRNRSK
jgi:hypothetical protein|tara:strand:- start:2583 stop:2861 length:279 start_codon:yes stop_codon:yes gene_type:complete